MTVKYSWDKLPPDKLKKLRSLIARIGFKKAVALLKASEETLREAESGGTLRKSTVERLVASMDKATVD